MTTPGERLSRPTRLIAGQSGLDCKSVFDTSVAETPPAEAWGEGLEVSLCYATKGFPVSLHEQADIQTYKYYLDNPPGIFIEDGCLAKIVDFAPDYESPMHKSQSVNFNYIIQGSVEVELDSGEKRQMSPGDVFVQRMANHKWRNLSSTKWARITAISIAAKSSAPETSESHRQW